MLYLGAFGQGQVPQAIIDLANRLQGPERRVFEGWTYGARGQFDLVEKLDGSLADVPPTSPVFPIAVKLRVDWRVIRSRQHSEAETAREALELLDDLLATYWSPGSLYTAIRLRLPSPVTAPPMSNLSGLSLISFDNVSKK